ncbi:MAG: tetratricopeptide repeat protein [Deltaproteobacteria bacterium]|nr:tetratricopeptide repeat protein [Deltaproteobacteria bacterium]
MSPFTRFARWLALACLLCGTTIAPPTRADEMAKRQFVKAQELHDSGDFGVALPLFETALETSGSPNARLYVARCLRELGRMPEAYNQMKRTLDEAASRAAQEPKYAPTRDAAATELAALEPLVARVTITVSEGQPAEVVLNGKPLDPADLGQPRAVPPGTVTIEATGAGAKPLEQTLEVATGQSETVTLTLEPAAAPAPAPPPPAPDTGDEDFMTTMRWMGVGVAVLGVGGMVSFAVTGSMARGKLDQLEEDCGGVRCSDPALADVVDEGKMLQTIANVSLGVGIAGLVGGSALFLFGGPSEDETTSASIRGTLGGGLLEIKGRF